MSSRLGMKISLTFKRISIFNINTNSVYFNGLKKIKIIIFNIKVYVTRSVWSMQTHLTAPKDDIYFINWWLLKRKFWKWCYQINLFIFLWIQNMSLTKRNTKNRSIEWFQLFTCLWQFFHFFLSISIHLIHIKNRWFVRFYASVVWKVFQNRKTFGWINWQCH